MELDIGVSVTIISDHIHLPIVVTSRSATTGTMFNVAEELHGRENTGIMVYMCVVVFKEQRVELPLLIVGSRGPSLLGCNCHIF